jgi:hypothetical protein
VKRKILIYVCIGLLVTMLSGCDGGQSSLWDQIKELEQEKADQAMRANALQQENEHLRQQTDTLSGLDKEVRLTELDTLANIKLGKRTGLYDKNDDGHKDALLVYIEPTDTQQDYIKAVGTVEVELWTAGAKLTEWILEPAELQKHWVGNLVPGYYLLPLNLDRHLTGKKKKLAIKVIFTDLLSGRVFADQKIIQP